MTTTNSYGWRKKEESNLYGSMEEGQDQFDGLQLLSFVNPNETITS